MNLPALTIAEQNASIRWRESIERIRRQPDAGPDDYRTAWNKCFAGWSRGPAPIWIPAESDIAATNAHRWAQAIQPGWTYADFHAWSTSRRRDFWHAAIERLRIAFREFPTELLDDAAGASRPVWCRGGKLNIVESCFQQDSKKIAVVSAKSDSAMQSWTHLQLREFTSRVSNSVIEAGFRPGDALAVIMPMTAISVAIYLGVIQAGCCVVSIADSFAPPEIETRLRISESKAVFTYDFFVRSGKPIPLYSRVQQATNVPIVVLSWDGSRARDDLRANDISWLDFLSPKSIFEPFIGDANQTINVLFSSGTTGDPKAIPWSHLTPIKCAVDGYVHQDIQPGHVCVWPTNLGWMMGPWLIFAALINRGTIGLFEDAPMGDGFGKFIEDARVNMLGVVPTIVKAWRSSRCMEAFDWSRIHVFSSTGECSQRDDMFYLSALAGMKPIIEYCGGTEIGGGYISSVRSLPNVPSAFNTPSIGLDFVLVDDAGDPADAGEVFLVPPSIGLSTRLLNGDHHRTYYEATPQIAGFPILRRHGDHITRLASGDPCFSYYVAGGRIDDTMNLGGIKISSAEIERVLNCIQGVMETAAVAVADQGGLDNLVVFYVGNRDPDDSLLEEMNMQLKNLLNPLFRVQLVEQVESLPRTASGKVMRRMLRNQVAS